MAYSGDRPHTAGGAAFVALTLVGWSSVPLFLEYFTDHTDSWTMNGWRYAMSALLWLPVLLVTWYRDRLPAGLWKAALVPSAINIVGQCCFARAPYYIDPGLLTFMLRFQIVFVALGAYLLFPAERGLLHSFRFWIGVVLAFGGSLGVCFFGAEIPSGTTLLGVLLAVAAGILFGAYSLAVKYFMSGTRPMFAFAAISQFTAAGLVCIMLLFGRGRGSDPLSFSGNGLLLLAISAVAGIALAHVCYYAAIARLGVTVAAGMILLQPFLTGTASSFMFGERLTAGQWASGAAALLGAVVMLHVQHSLSRRPVTRDVSAGVNAKLDAGVSRCVPD